MNRLVAVFCFTSSLMNIVTPIPIIPTGGLALATGPPSLGDSSVHYAYNRQYDYGHHYAKPLIHHVTYDYGYAPHHSLVDHYGVIHDVLPTPAYHAKEVLLVHDGYGHGHKETVKHGYKNTHVYGGHGYEHEVKHEHHSGYGPYHSGYVPDHGKAALDHGVGYAVGHDAIGHFDHHTGPFGPFGFYANYYHD